MPMLACGILDRRKGMSLVAALEPAQKQQAQSQLNAPRTIDASVDLFKPWAIAAMAAILLDARRR